MDMSILSELEELQRCLEESDPEETLPLQTSKPSIVATGDSGSDLENLLQSEYMSLAGISEDAKSAEEVKSKAKKGVSSDNPQEPENSDDIVKKIFGDEHPKVGTAEKQPTKEISASESIVVTGDTKRQSEVQLAKDGINLELGERKFAELENNLETKDSAVIASDAKNSEVATTDAKNSDVAGTKIAVGEVTDLISSVVPASNFEDRVSPAVSYCQNSLIVVSDGKKSSAIIPVVNEKNSEFTIDDSAKSLAAVSNEENSAAPVVDAKDSSVSGVIDLVEIANATVTDTESELQNNSDACPGSPFLKIEQVFSVTPQVHRDGIVGDVLIGEGELGEGKDNGLSPKDMLIKKRKIQMDSPSQYKTKAQLARLSSSKRRKLYTEPSEESGLVHVSSGSSSPEACLKLQSSDQTKPKARQRLSTQFSRKMKADLNDTAPSPKKIKLTKDKSTESIPKSCDIGSIKSEIIPTISQMETNTNIMGTVNPDIILSNLLIEKTVPPLCVDEQFIEQEVERFGKQLLQARVVLKRLKIPIPEHLLSGSKKEEKKSVNLQNTLAKVSKDIQETLNKPAPVDVFPQKGKHGKSKQTNKKPSCKESKPLEKKSKGQKMRHNMMRTPSVSVRIRPKRKRILTKKILASKLQAQARARKTVSRAKNKTATVVKANDTDLKSILVKKDKKSIVKKKVVFKDEMLDVKKLKKLNAMKTASEKKDAPAVKTVPLKKTVPVKNPMPKRKTTSVALENKIYPEQEKTTNKKTVPVKNTMPEKKITSVALENKIYPEQEKTTNKKTVPVKNTMPERKTTSVALKNKIYPDQEKTNKKTIPVKNTMPERKTTSVAIENKIYPEQEKATNKKIVPVKNTMLERKTSRVALENKIDPEQEKTTNKKTVCKKANTAHEHKNLPVQSAKVNVEKKTEALHSDKNTNASEDEQEIPVKKKRGRKPFPKPTGNFVKLSPAGIPLGRPRKTATPLGRPRKTATSCPAHNVSVNMGSRLKESKANVKSTATDKGKEEDSGNDPGEDEWIVEMLLDDEVEVLTMSDATRVSSSDEKPNSSQADRNDSVPECDSSTDKKVRSGQSKDNINNTNESPKPIERTARKVSSTMNVGVQVQRNTDVTLERKMTEMKKAIGDLERIADRSMLRLKAEERQVIYLSNKLRTYENDKHYKVLRRILKDAAPGPNQNADAVFIIDLMLSYCPNDGENDEEHNETASTSSRTPQTGGGGK